MKDPTNNIRQWLYNVLNGVIFYNSVPVPVYSFPPKDTSFPYIVIAEQSMSAEDGTKDAYITSNDVTIEIYSSHSGNDATYVVVTSIAEDILEIVRQRAIETHGSGGQTITTITGFNPVSITLAGSQTDRFLLENSIVIYKSVNINLLLEES